MRKNDKFRGYGWTGGLARAYDKNLEATANYRKRLSVQRFEISELKFKLHKETALRKSLVKNLKRLKDFIGLFEKYTNS